MKGMKLVGAVLIALGILGLVYGGFSYTKRTDEVSLGPVHVEVQEKRRVNVPLWLGAAVVVVGAVLLARKA